MCVCVWVCECDLVLLRPGFWNVTLRRWVGRDKRLEETTETIHTAIQRHILDTGILCYSAFWEEDEEEKEEEEEEEEEEELSNL